MTALLQYQALDQLGDEILDKLEEQGESSRRYPVNVREFLVAVEGEGDLDPALDEIDPDWRDHVRRVTAPEPPVVTRFDERPPGTPPDHRAIGERPSDSEEETVTVYLPFEGGADRVIVCPPGATPEQLEELKDALPKPNVDLSP